MQSEYEREQLQEEIPYPNVITFQDWNTIKQYGNITKGTTGFIPEDLDEAVVFFDENLEYIDYLERRKVEDIIPVFVMLPRFFWEDRRETMPEDFLPQLRIPDRLKLLSTEREYWTNLESRALAGTETLPIKADFKLRSEQEPVFEYFRNQMQTNHTIRGILQAGPGFGKTSVSIYILSKFRANAIIIVPNEILASQWAEAIENFTDLNKEDIGIIQGSNLKDNLCEVEKSISIVKVQSLFSQIKHNHLLTLQQFYRSKDVVFCDEVHTTGGAASYSKTTSLFLTPNIIGLTATPFRQGVNDFLLKSSVGEVIFKATHQNLIPDVEIHKIYAPFSEAEEKRLNQFGSDYNIKIGVFNSFMNTKDEYFDYISNIINWNFQNGHNIVILLPTIKLMEKLQSSLIKLHPHLEKEQLLLKGKTKEDMQIIVKEKRKNIMVEYKAYKEYLDEKVKSKDMKRKEATEKIKNRRTEIDSEISYLKDHALDLYKKATKKARIVISNPNLLSAGYDDPKLSNLIIGAAPRIGKVPVIQSVGRVVRIFDNKPKPLVQYFIPNLFYKINKNVNHIITNNIKLQYPNAKFIYKGMENG